MHDGIRPPRRDPWRRTLLRRCPARRRPRPPGRRARASSPAHDASRARRARRIARLPSPGRLELPDALFREAPEAAVRPPAGATGGLMEMVVTLIATVAFGLGFAAFEGGRISRTAAWTQTSDYALPPAGPDLDGGDERRREAGDVDGWPETAPKPETLERNATGRSAEPLATRSKR